VATYLDANISVELDDLASYGVVNDLRFTVSIGIALRMMTRDVIEVIVVGEVQQEVITARRVDCK